MSMTTGMRQDAITGITEVYEYEIDDELQAKEQYIANLQQRILEIPSILSAGDYKTTKYTEGDLSEEEWITHCESRKALRAEFKAIEAEIASLSV